MGVILLVAVVLCLWRRRELTGERNHPPSPDTRTLRHSGQHLSSAAGDESQTSPRPYPLFQPDTTPVRLKSSPLLRLTAFPSSSGNIHAPPVEHTPAPLIQSPVVDIGVHDTAGPNIYEQDAGPLVLPPRYDEAWADRARNPRQQVQNKQNNFQGTH